VTKIVLWRARASRDDWHPSGPEDRAFGERYLPEGWEASSATSYTYDLAIGYREKWKGSKRLCSRQLAAAVCTTSIFRFWWRLSGCCAAHCPTPPVVITRAALLMLTAISGKPNRTLTLLRENSRENVVRNKA